MCKQKQTQGWRDVKYYYPYRNKVIVVLGFLSFYYYPIFYVLTIPVFLDPNLETETVSDIPILVR